MKINFNLNGADVNLDVPSDLRVIDLLREHLNLTGTKESCGSGECGSCTILVNGESRLSCLILASQLNGKHVRTIEGISNGKSLHVLQEEFVKKGAVQCGFCTPGMVISAIDLLKRRKNPSREEIREGISGNICRCTGYQKIVDAIEAASQKEITVENFETDFSLSKPIRLNKIKENAKVFLPNTLEELWDILDNKDDLVIFSGGTDVLTKRRKGIISKNKNLICLENINELKKIEENDNWVFIGAGATHISILENKLIQKYFSVLIDALKGLGSPQIRHMGTIGGNICTASPAGDTLPPLYALEAILDIRSKNTKREISIKEFIKAPGKIELSKDEILYGVKIRKSNFNLQYYEKVGQRNALSISIAGIAVVGDISSEKIINKIKIAWGSVAPTVVTSENIEKRLIGKKLNKETIKSIFPLIEATVSPIDDIRAGKDYRLSVSKNLLLRILS